MSIPIRPTARQLTAQDVAALLYTCGVENTDANRRRIVRAWFHYLLGGAIHLNGTSLVPSASADKPGCYYVVTDAGCSCPDTHTPCKHQLSLQLAAAAAAKE